MSSGQQPGLIYRQDHQETTSQPPENAGDWDNQRDKTANSFQDLLDKNLIAVNAWRGRADDVDPPPAWQTALGVVGQMVLAGALGGVGGVLAGSLINATTKLAVQFVINAAIEAGKKGLEEGINAAISSAGNDRDAALEAFCIHQQYGLVDAKAEARERFIDASGSFMEQNLTIAQMEAIQDANDAARARAEEIQSERMLIGWMNLLAGGGVGQETNLEDTRQRGVLGLVIEGQDDMPTRILSANAEGLNENLRGDLSGSKLGRWVSPDAEPGQSTVDIVVKTGVNRYRITQGTRATLEAAGVFPGSLSQSAQVSSIHFALGMNGGDRSNYWIDTDWGGLLQNDYMWSADAGRYFLKQILDFSAFWRALADLELPSVDG